MVKWCIYIAPFPCNMLKGALQWSVYPQRTGSIYRRLWQPLQISPCMLVLILPTPGGWKAEWTLAGKKVTQIFNPRPGRESNREPQDWEAEILTTAPTPPLWTDDPWKVSNIERRGKILTLERARGRGVKWTPIGFSDLKFEAFK